MKPDLSLIYPARNEAAYIGRCLQAALPLKATMSVEIIVVDNESTDDTYTIARQFADVVFRVNSDNVASLRNYGVLSANGKVIAFIDADVEITPLWRRSIEIVVRSMNNEEFVVTGSRCHAQTSTRFLDKYWFNRLLEYKSTYINSGNLVTSRKLFDSINGFDESLQTSEDHDFCSRAEQAGAVVKEDRTLEAVHHGYPGTFIAFINRERWHGRQDFMSLQTALNSKVALVILCNFAVFFIALVLTALSGALIWIALWLGWLALLSCVLTLKRYRYKSFRYFFGTSGVFLIYIVGRSLSCFDRIVGMREHGRVSEKDGG